MQKENAVLCGIMTLQRKCTARTSLPSSP